MTGMLSDAFLKRLDALQLRMKHPASGGSGGLRRSKALGSSVEFSDFREYAAGDDIRRVDWNAYARFDRLFLKLFMEEQEQRVNLIVDASASMAFGEPTKWEAAKMLIQALSYLSLCGGDRLTLFTLSGGKERHTRQLSGRHCYPEAAEFVESTKPEGETLLDLPRLPLPAVRGLSVLISDMLCEGGYERALQSLLYRKQETGVVMLWSREEWDPALEGPVELLDSETGQAFALNAGFDLLRRYRKTAQAYVEEVRAFCRSNGISHAFTIPEADFEEQMLRELSHTGLIS